MSKSATNRKTSPTSAWHNGPPSIAQSSAASSTVQRPSSPAQSSHKTPSHSRKPSGLSFNDGPVSIPRNAPTHQNRNSVTFGSIDNASAVISSSPPAPASTIKSDGVKSFGSVPATAAATDSAPKERYDFRKSFRTSTAPATSNAAPSNPPPSSQPTTSSPVVSPSQPIHYRPNGPPRSPVASRQIPNGTHRPPQPPPNNIPSPPMAQPQIPGMPPQPPMVPHGWSPYPYDVSMYYPWPYQQMPPGPPMQPQPQPPPPVSPRQPPQVLQQQPSTPTPAHAGPSPVSTHPPHPPPSHGHTSSVSSVTSQPATPSTASGSQAGRFNVNASSFVPTPKKVTIKAPDGTEFNFGKVARTPATTLTPTSSSPSPLPPSSPSAASRRSAAVRVESEDAKKKRLAEEQEKENKLKAQQQAKIEREQAEEKKREEEEKERIRKEEEAKRLEEEKKRKEEQRKKEEEAKRKREEEEERKRKEEEELQRKREEEEAARRKEEEEREKEEKEKEERRKKEEEAEKQRLAELRAEEAKRNQSPVPTTTSPAPSTAPPPTADSKDLEEGEIKESSPAPPEPKVKPKEGLGLRIDTEHGRKGRPGPLDLSGATKSNVAPPLPSALATAKRIENLSSVVYPEGIKSPKPELNVGAQDGRFKYDRDFLLQFMNICKEKPDQLPPLDAIGLEPNEQTYAMSRTASGHRPRQGSNAPIPGRSASVALGANQPFGKGGPGFGAGSSFANFGVSGKAGDGRATPTARSTSVGGLNPFPSVRQPGNLSRTPSQGGPGHNKRTRSQRGGTRNQNNAAQPATLAGPSVLPLEPVAPLQHTANRWDRRALTADNDSPELVERKVKALLNKLTMEKFDSISDQIIEWANKSEKEKDGRTLIQVIRLVFEKATDEAAWSEMYARLCRKMMEQISPKVQDDGIKNAEGKPITGGQLFRKYLLNRCQEDFERGWVAKEATAAAAKSKSKDDEAVKASAQQDGSEENGEVALYSDEYYAAQKAKRQGLGLIRFIGELFKLQMLTERIMHECVKKLLGNVETPEEEEIESLCKLLTTVGQILDTTKARAHMDIYFQRMQDMTKSANVSARMQFMLQDVIELRERKWVSRGNVAAPTTIAAVREQAAKEKAAQDKESYKMQMSMSRGGSRRGADRSETPVGPDGWSVAGSAAQRVPPKAGDLSQFGKINKAAPMSFAPTTFFSKKNEKRESMSRTTSNSNMFSILNQSAELSAEDPSANKGSRPPSRKSSIDLGGNGPSDGLPQRKKLVLAPRTVHKDSEPETAELSDEAATKKIDEDLKEFFGIRSIAEAESYFSGLPVSWHFKLVDKLTSQAIESKQADAQLVADLFSRASADKWCSSTTFEEGFGGLVEVLEDIAIDAPKAFDFMAIIVRGASLDDSVRSRIASKDASGKLAKLLSDS